MTAPIRSAPVSPKASRSARTKRLHVDIDYSDLHAYMPTHQYIYIPTRELWSATSIDNRLPKRILCDDKGAPVLDDDGEQILLKASAWLDKKRHVEQMTWCPGKPMILPDTVVSDGGWVTHPGSTCYNLYRPPIPLIGHAPLALPWVEHVRRVFPDDADHLFGWFAHRAQRPWEKINHALVLGGKEGIGKDTILEPVKTTVGPWNFTEISPTHLMGRFNGFVKSVILRINEARDLGEIDRFSFYDHLKPFTAAPPDVLRVDEKNLREHAVFNVCGVVITTNYKTNGIYLSPDDRRHYVAWSELSKDDFPDGYFRSIYDWFAVGGYGHVSAWLNAYDLSTFDAKRPPRHTDAWHDIVTSSQSPEDADMADVLDRLHHPDAITIQLLAESPTPKAFSEWLLDPKNRRSIPHRLSEVHYTQTFNAWTKEGFWSVNGRRQVIYTKVSLSKQERLQAALALCQGAPATF